MKTTIAIAAALAAGASTQLFAAAPLNAKEDVITFTLTASKQTSVSTSATVANAGTWEELPFYYKTGTSKVTQANIIQFIGYVLYGNSAHYSSTAQLVLDQGELSGFFGITPNIAKAVAGNTGGETDGTFSTVAGFPDTDTLTDLNDASASSFTSFANGRHMLENLHEGAATYPVGHIQPWGQIWVKDTKKGLYDNVTFFFAISIQECYDCFYLSSYISQSTFKKQTHTTPQSGPPCCNTVTTSAILGSGKDSYYMTLSFDNTVNNPYLYPKSSCYVGDFVGNGAVVGVGYPLASATIPGDAISPDTLPYDSSITSHLGKNLPYEARFTLNGIMTYTWNLNFINGGADVQPEFVGNGVYSVCGYGFISLYCSLLTGTVNFSEKIVKFDTTVDALAVAPQVDSAWKDNWYGIGAEYVAVDNDTGYETAYEKGFYLVPVNVATSLSYHENFNIVYPANLQDFAPAAWPHPAYVPELIWDMANGSLPSQGY